MLFLIASAGCLCVMISKISGSEHMIFKDQRLLLFSALLLGLAPFGLRLAGATPHQGAGILIFGLTVFVCVLGATTQYRLFWIAYGIACAATLALFGMSSPLALLLILPGLQM
jgi:hypothetical protein